MIATSATGRHRPHQSSQNGRQHLERLFDGSGVDRLWVAGWHIDWVTGRADKTKPAGGKDTHTHCSAFVAAIAMRVGVYILRPPQHPQQLLANAQAEWLPDTGYAFGWREVPDEWEAQAAANEGRLTVASYKNPKPKESGHIAFVRPSSDKRWQVMADGPAITQAGGHNFIVGTLRQGFGSRRNTVRYFAGDIP